MADVSFRDRLKTVDEVGNRIWVYSDTMGGIWRKRRQIVAFVLLVFYFAVPWIRISRLPLLQIDFGHGRIIFMGQIFWAHEVSYFIPLVLSFAFGVFSLTAWKGRVFCGWACPQTVYLEFIYRPIERLIEGVGAQRRAIDALPWSKKFPKKALKFIIFGLFSFLVGNTFLALFVGTDELLHAMSLPPWENPGFFSVVAFVTAAFQFNFGWFREQMCTITCPYGRLQSVLLDEGTMFVGYDYKRGEPRGKLNTVKGDCVDCKLCVKVCPTGIDIRDGLQLECVGCMECSDACNDVMTKIKKPINLIGYTSLTQLQTGKPLAFTRKRPFVYMALSVVLLVIGVTLISIRAPFDVQVQKKQTTDYSMSGDDVVNQFTLNMRNRGHLPLRVQFSDPTGEIKILAPADGWTLAPFQSAAVEMKMSLPKSDLKHGLATKDIQVSDQHGRKKTLVLHFWGPG